MRTRPSLLALFPLAIAAIGDVSSAPAAGKTDAEFFESVGPLRGLKGNLYEGGIRVPMIARWRRTSIR